MKLSSLYLKSSMTRPTTDDRSDQLPNGWLPSNHLTYGVCERCCTHRRIVLRLGNAPWRPMLKYRLKSRWVTQTDSPLLTNATYTNTWCSTGQVSVATEVATPNEKKADHLVPPPPAYLLSTTHSKDDRFPWVTLYFTPYVLPMLHTSLCDLP